MMTPGKDSLLRAVSVCTKTALISGCVGGAGEWSHTCTLGTYLLCPKYADLLQFPNKWSFGRNFSNFFSHFYYNKSCNFLNKFLPKLHLFGNCYKSAYLESRGITKMSPTYKYVTTLLPLSHCS